MRTVILHVGMDKTGSTSIQRFLSAARSTLLRQGVLYPTISSIDYGFFSDHEALCALLVSEDFWESPNAGRFSHHEEAFFFASEWVSVIKEQIAQGNIKNLLLSSEAFYSLPIYGLFNLRRLLSDLGIDDVKVFIFIDSPSNRYRSQTSQRIVSGREIKVPHIQVVSHYIERLITVFGEAAVNVLDFQRSRLEGGAVEIFLRNSGIPRPDGVQEVNENASLSAEALHLIEIMDRTGDLGGFKSRNDAVVKIALLDFRVGNRSRLRLRSDVANAIDYLSVDYNWLRDRFGIQYDSSGYSNSYLPSGLSRVPDLFVFSQTRFEDMAAEFWAPSTTQTC